MKQNMKVLGFILAIVTAVVAFSSCTNSMDEPTLSIEGKLENRDTRAILTSDLDGWNMVINEGDSYGYKLYEQNGNYLQKINLQMGAYLSVGTTSKTANPSLSSSPLFSRTSMQVFWNQRPTKTLSVTNCQFFIPQDDVNTGTAACPLSYPVKNGGIIISTGSTNNDGIPKRKLGINTSTREAWVASYSNESNDASTVASHLQSPTVIVGTNPYLDSTRKPSWAIGRTMVGIKDQNEDGKKEVLYILTGVYTQSSATEILTGLGCLKNDIIMLDGHYSSQMIAKNVDFYSSVIGIGKKRRNVPCVLYVRYR